MVWVLFAGGCEIDTARDSSCFLAITNGMSECAYLPFASAGNTGEHHMAFGILVDSRYYSFPDGQTGVCLRYAGSLISLCRGFPQISK